MSSDEVYQKRYNIQPNPYKGAQASVLARFGHQAQSLAGTAGKGSAVAGAAKAKSDEITQTATRDLGGNKIQADAIGRLRQIQNEMQSDSLINRRSIAEAQLEQNEDTPWYETAAAGLSVYNSFGQLARGVDFALGGDANVQYDEDKYNENYEQLKQQAAEEAGVPVEELTHEQLREIHKEALNGARSKQGAVSGALGDVAGGIGKAFESIPIIGQPLKDLRRANLKAAAQQKSVQENTVTKDMAEKKYTMIENFMTGQKDQFGKTIELTTKNQEMLFEFFGEYLGLIQNGPSFIDPIQVEVAKEADPIPEFDDPDEENESFPDVENSLPDVLKSPVKEY